MKSGTNCGRDIWIAPNRLSTTLEEKGDKMSDALVRLIGSDNGSLSLSLDTTVKATLLLLAAAFVSTLLYRISAAARHRMWCLTFAGLLLLPVLSSLLPGWRVPILPRTLQVEETVVAASDGTVLAEPGLSPEGAVAESALRPISDEASEEFDPALSTIETGENPEPSERATLPPVPKDEAVRSGEPTPPISTWSAFPGLAWVLGACVAVLPVFLGPWRDASSGSQRSRGRRRERRLRLVRELCRDLGIGRTVHTLWSRTVLSFR